MSTIVRKATTELVDETCCVCGTWFAMESALRDLRRRDGKGFTCPNGHSQVYTDTDTKKLERAERNLAQYRTWLEREEANRRAAERSASALRGVVTKTKRRVAAGVCPCCNRSFKALANHMASKHPEYADSATS